MQGRQAVLIGQVRADPALEELADCGEDKGSQGLGAEVGPRACVSCSGPCPGHLGRVLCCSQDSRGAHRRQEGPQSPG